MTPEDNFQGGLKIPRGEELSPDELNYGGGFRKKTPEEIKQDFSVDDNVFLLYKKMDFIRHFFGLDLYRKTMPEMLLYMSVLDNMDLELDREGIKKVKYKENVIFLRKNFLHKKSIEDDIEKVEKPNQEERQRVYQIEHQRENEPNEERLLQELGIAKEFFLEQEAIRDLENGPYMALIDVGYRVVTDLVRGGKYITLGIYQFFTGEEIRQNLRTGKELALATGHVIQKVPGAIGQAGVVVDKGAYLTNIVLNATGTGDALDAVGEGVGEIPPTLIEWFNTALDSTGLGEGIDAYGNVTTTDVVGLSSLAFKKYIYGMSDKDILNGVTPVPKKTLKPQEKETLSEKPQSIFSEDTIRKEGERVLEKGLDISSIAEGIKESTLFFVNNVILILALLIIYNIVS